MMVQTYIATYYSYELMYNVIKPLDTVSSSHKSFFILPCIYLLWNFDSTDSLVHCFSVFIEHGRRTI